MREITTIEKKPWHEVMSLRNSSTYQYYRSEEGRHPQKIGKRFIGRDRKKNIPEFQEGYCYNIKRIRCIAGTHFLKGDPDLITQSDLIPKKPIAKKIYITTTHITLVCLIVMVTLLVIANIEDDSDAIGSLWCLIAITCIAFKKNISLPAASEKIVNNVYNIPNLKIRRK